MILSSLHFLALILIGIFTAFVNSIAGGGSMLSLPILLFFGLPASVANGTNRLGISPGMLSSVLGLKKKGYFPFAQALRIAPPVIVGALAGSFLAVRIPDEQLKLLIAILIIVLSVLIFMDSYGKVGNSAGDGKGYFQKSLLKQSATVSSELQLNWKQGWYLGRLPTIVYMLVGFYGSFLQIGFGFVMLFVFSKMTNYNLFQANAVKGAVGLVFTAISLVFFIAAGKIYWPYAAALAIGNWVGGGLGSSFQIRKGERWVQLVVLMLGMLMASKLLFDVCLAWFKQ